MAQIWAFFLVMVAYCFGYNKAQIRISPDFLASLNENRNELRRTLSNVNPDDSNLMGSSVDNGMNIGDFSFLPYPSSDIVEFHYLDNNNEIPHNPNQHPKYVDYTTIPQLVDIDSNFSQELCEQNNLFVGDQAELCKAYLPLMPALVRGYAAGISECEYQFRNEKWNCQGHNQTSQRSLLRQKRQSGPIRVRTYMENLLSRSSKEAAYVLAITSAGIMHSVTKACSNGKFLQCGCDSTKLSQNEPDQDYTWGGCSDNVSFGEAISRTFLDAGVKLRYKRNLKVVHASLHNNVVGRHVVSTSLEKKCKCHGASGSCELKTCWMSLPEFRVIGNQLRAQFEQSRQVEMYNGNLVMKLDQTFEARFARGTHVYRNYPYRQPLYLSRPVREPIRPDQNQLVFLKESPNFCHEHAPLGSMGTVGRVCQIKDQNNSHCDIMCCGRGYIQQKVEITRKCKCKFKWCCEVKCELCKETVSIYRCR